MTPNYVHIQLARAVMLAFDAGRQLEREAFVSPVTSDRIKDASGAAIANAASIVMEPVRLLADEAAQMAVVEACHPYAELLHGQEGGMLMKTPEPGSALFAVWLHGALRMADAMAKQGGGLVDLDRAADAVNDGGDLVEAIAASLLQQVRDRVLQ